MGGINLDNERSILDDINEVEVEEVSPAGDSSPAGGMGIDLSFLKAKTGTGTIEDYVEHPMNFNKSKGLGQVIRGFTGLFGALDLAIIDIIIGLLQMGRDKTNANKLG